MDKHEEGEDVRMAEQRKLNKKLAQRKEPALPSVEVDQNGAIKFESVNIRQLHVSYYIINAELLFTRQPFLLKNEKTE